MKREEIEEIGKLMVSIICTIYKIDKRPVFSIENLRKDGIYRLGTSSYELGYVKIDIDIIRKTIITDTECFSLGEEIEDCLVNGEINNEQIQEWYAEGLTEKEILRDKLGKEVWYGSLSSEVEDYEHLVDVLTIMVISHEIRHIIQVARQLECTRINRYMYETMDYEERKLSLVEIDADVFNIFVTNVIFGWVPKEFIVQDRERLRILEEQGRKQHQEERKELLIIQYLFNGIGKNIDELVENLRIVDGKVRLLDKIYDTVKEKLEER